MMLGVLTIYDPATGLATRPVAGLSRDVDDTVSIDWLPGPAAALLRAELAGFAPVELVGWLDEHQDPVGLRCVTWLDVDGAGELSLAAFVDELIVNGTWR